MELKNYICEGNKFIYNKGYIGLPVEINGLPKTIKINGEILHKKSSFHTSLVCVKDILARKPNIEQKILNEFCTFVNKNKISFVKYTGEFRFAQYEERKTIIALCEVLNIKSFSRLLSKKFSINIPDQPTHVTLFTLQPDAGIGLNSFTDLEIKSKKIEPPVYL